MLLSHFTEAETEVRRGRSNGPRPHSYLVGEAKEKHQQSLVYRTPRHTTPPRASSTAKSGPSVASTALAV